MADIIYVSGGDTISMMQTWKKYGMNEKIKQIYAKDSAVLTGISVGAIYHYSHSDIEAFVTENDPYKAAYGSMPSHASANPEIKQLYINGHFAMSSSSALSPTDWASSATYLFITKILWHLILISLSKRNPPSLTKISVFMRKSR